MYPPPAHRYLDRAGFKPRNTMVSVKTREPVDKADMFKVIERLRAAAVSAPVAIGDIVLADVCGTDIVATKEID